MEEEVEWAVVVAVEWVVLEFQPEGLRGRFSNAKT